MGSKGETKFLDDHEDENESFISARSSPLSQSKEERTPLVDSEKESLEDYEEVDDQDENRLE